MLRRLLRERGFDLIRYPSRLSFQWHLTRLFERLGINCVLDVGANHGQYAQHLRACGYRGAIVSFEPVPEVFAALQRTMAGDANWRGFAWALGDSEGEADIHVSGGDAQASSFLPFNEDGPARWGDAHRVAQTIRVPVRRLDRIFDHVTAHVVSPRIYLKLDTQGFDLRVMAGAGARVADILALQTELAWHSFYEGMTRFGDALEQYRALGYDVTGLFPLSRELDELRVIEFDCVLIRR